MNLDFIIKETYKALEKPFVSRYGKIVQLFLLINVIVNILMFLSREFLNLPESLKHVVLIIEYFTVFIFIVELIARYVSIGVDPRYRGLKGKIIYTLKPLTLIDIFTLIPYFFMNAQYSVLSFRMIRFFNIFRFLKLFREENLIKSFFSVRTFATSSIWRQSLILLILSSVFVLIFSFVYKDGGKISYLMFLDPTSLVDVNTNVERVFGIIEVLLGLFVGGALISIITEMLTNISSNIKNGYYPYKGKDHIIIINYNSKLEFILNEIDHYYKDIEQIKDVVLFLPFVENIEDFNQNLTKYSNIRIFLIKGEVFNWESYERLNVNYTSKILILKPKDDSIKDIDIKISKFIISHPNFVRKNIPVIVESELNRINETIFNEIFEDKYPHVVIDHNFVISQFLNRSIIEPLYFKIYTSLLTFDGYEFYILDFSEVFNEKLTFKEAFLRFKDGVLVGIIKNNQVMLNPNKDIILSKDVKLITILENRFEYEIIEKCDIRNINLKNIPKPKLKIDRQIVIVGNYNDFDVNSINDFLTTESIKKLKKIIFDNDKDYLKDEFWEKEIINKNYDMIILNLEDNFEFILTMYLKSRYKNNKKFLKSIVNIIHDPVTAQLLIDKKNENNIIISEKMVGEYTTQALFNPVVIQIFDEITHSKGTEFYLLDRKEYGFLFDMNYEELKYVLFENEMIYIGAIVNNEFITDYKNISNSEQLVVLTKGV